MRFCDYCKFIRTETSYRQSENGIANCHHSHTCMPTKFGELLVYKWASNDSGVVKERNFHHLLLAICSETLRQDIQNIYAGYTPR